ncbi:MAG: GAF domain-containing protein, partial [Frankia sp.]|nr:GAF domain-containing protein [Frankia sp.]
PAPRAGEGGGATRPVGWAEPAQPTADAGGDGGHGHGDVRQPVGVYAHIRASVGRRASHVTSGPVSTQPGSLVWRVLTAGEPVVIEDLAARADITREDWLQGDGAVSTVAVPIIANGRAWGILAAHSTSRRRFTRDEAYFVHSVAHVLSAAVERAETQEDRARLAVFEDRDRIACELHDLVIQRLFSVGLRLQSLIRMVPEPGAVRMSAAIADLDETIDEIRRTIFDLRPPYTY